MVATTKRCPKCNTERADQPACPKCGLAADRMEAFAKERDALAPDVLVAAWDRAVESWEDPARHDEVIRLVAANDAYAWAAARYRTRSGDPIGDRQLARVRKAAEAALLASASIREDKTPKPYRALTAVLVMLIIAAVAGLLYAMVVHDGSTDATRGNATPAEPAKPLQPIQRPSTN